MELKALKVSEVNQYIKRILVSDPVLFNINVEGEISNFTHHYNGHMYFTLKDNNSRLKCIMFNNNQQQLGFVPKDGMKVIVTGYVSVYERDGSYQLYAKNIRTKGLGDLYAAFLQMKENLEKEGLFDQKHKKALPILPLKIGVVTSSTGAAVRDIITVIKRRNPNIEILIFPVLVQGERAHIEICRGLKYFDGRSDIDIVITGRGGGSIEELWAFNEEDVARTIFSMRIPVISAVGHETDFTIADFVADLRAPTPSTAGEMSTPDLNELKSKIHDSILRLNYIFKNYLKSKNNEVDMLRTKLLGNSPVYKLNENKNKIRNLSRDLIKAINTSKDELRGKLNVLGGKLNALSPLSTLDRGYTLTMDINDKPIETINDIKVDEIIKVRLKDGKVLGKVIKLEKERGI